MSYRQKDGHLDQWNRRKSRNRLTHRWELTFDKGTKTIQEKMTIFLRNGARSLYKKFYLDPYFVPITKLNSKWTNDLQIKCKSTEFLEVKGIKSMSNYTWWVMVKLRKMWSSSPIMRFLISLSLLWIPAHRVPSPHAEVALSGPPPADAGHHEYVVNRFLSIAHLLLPICPVTLGYKVLILRATRKSQQT